MLGTVATGLSNPVHLLGLLGVIAFWIGPAVLVGRLAARRGRSFAVYLVASLLIWWPVPLFVALIMPRRRDRHA